ncbi:hypothetical protein ILUMI_16822 [Ignelater luminosus]|uniref:Uncharacterized protein n=1 Tax=Ignelater luminosus TaxID=2038154 RepID=A0A8K0G858_IGNLU|nr:hypothetical protein ILUMI_16822 [Ignelater luminosus]
MDKALLQDDQRAFETRSRLFLSPPRPLSNTIAEIRIETPKETRQEGDRKNKTRNSQRTKRISHLHRSTNTILKATLNKMKQNAKNLQKTNEQKPAKSAANVDDAKNTKEAGTQTTASSADTPISTRNEVTIERCEAENVTDFEQTIRRNSESRLGGLMVHEKRSDRKHRNIITNGYDDIDHNMEERKKIERQ